MSPDRDDLLSRLYQREAVAEPSPAMDALILAAAHRQAAEPLTPRRASAGWRRWLAPVGVLATIVLTVSLTLNIEREQRDLLPAPAPAMAPAAAPPTIAKSVTAVPQPAVVAPPVAARPAAPLERQAKPQKEALPDRPVIAKPVASRALALPAAPAQPAADSRRDESKRRELQQDETRAAAPPPPPLVPQFVPSPASAVGGAAGRMSSTESAAPAAVRAAPAPAADKRERSMAKVAVRPADEWIVEIRRLRREGRGLEVQEQLEAFRRAYPDYRLPEDLKAD
jgi:Meckel syndrome type 1 protein